MKPLGLRLRAWDYDAADRDAVPAKLSRSREKHAATKTLARDLDSEADAEWFLDYTASCGDPSCGNRCSYYDDPWFVSDAIGIVSYIHRERRPLTFRLADRLAGRGEG